MSESKSLVKLQRLLLMSDSDMAAAAQQLMQLSDEDNNSSSSNSNDNNNNDSNNKKIKAKMINSKRFFEQRDEITSAKIEEIFGKEDEILRPIKKRRYRLLVSLYKETKPIKVSYGKNLWY